MTVLALVEDISPSSLTLHLLHLFFCSFSLPSPRLCVCPNWHRSSSQYPSQFWANFHGVTSQLKWEGLSQSGRVVQDEVPCKDLLPCSHPGSCQAPRPAGKVVPRLLVLCSEVGSPWPLLLFKRSRDNWEPANVLIDVRCTSRDDGRAHCLHPNNTTRKYSQQPRSSTWRTSPRWWSEEMLIFSQRELKTKPKKNNSPKLFVGAAIPFPPACRYDIALICIHLAHWG